jgi:hypothetical protein
MNVENETLVEPSNILLRSVHLKFGPMKNFVKAVNQEEDAFTYLRKTFPGLSEAKLKEGIFIGPQIRDLIKDDYFDYKDSQNIAASFANRTTELGLFITQERIGLPENLWNN